MNCYGAKDIAGAFRTVRNNTIKIAEEIPEDKYNFSAAKDTRTIAQMLVHIAVVPRMQHMVHSEKLTTLGGIDFPTRFQNILAEEQKPRTKAEIIALLQEEGEKFASFVESVSDDFLAERVAMPPGMQPESKSRFEMLIAPKEHEMHHRGQLMTMQRMLGLVPHLTREIMERFARMQAQTAKS